VEKEYDIRPVGNRVAIRRDTATKQTPGGLALPDNIVEHPRMGTVIAVGPGAFKAYDPGEDSIRYPMECQVGDRVVMPHTAELILLDPNDPSSEVVICQEFELLAILT